MEAKPNQVLHNQPNHMFYFVSEGVGGGMPPPT